MTLKNQSADIFFMQLLKPSVLILFVYLSNNLGEHMATGSSNSVYLGND